MTLTLLLLAALTAHARTLEAFEQGRIKFSDETISGKHEVNVGTKKPVDPNELTTLMHLYMNKACANEFLYLDVFKKTQETGPVTTAYFGFHCSKTPDFFQGDAKLQKTMVKDLCAQPQKPYLRKLCEQALK